MLGSNPPPWAIPRHAPVHESSGIILIPFPFPVGRHSASTTLPLAQPLNLDSVNCWRVPYLVHCRVPSLNRNGSDFNSCSTYGIQVSQPFSSSIFLDGLRCASVHVHWSTEKILKSRLFRHKFSTVRAYMMAITLVNLAGLVPGSYYLRN